MNTTPSKSIGLLALVGLLSLLSACGSSPKSWSQTNVEKRNKVEFVRLTHDIDFSGAGPEVKALPAQSAEALDAFLNKSRISYNDELSIDLPLTKDGDVTKANLMRRNALATYLAGRGLTLATTLTPYGTEPQPETIRLVVGRYVVTTPTCGDWSKPAGPDYQNTPGSNLGCATESALGQMIANPHDLIEGRDSAPASGVIGAKAVQNYHEGISAKATSSTSGASGASATTNGTGGSATSGN